MLQPGLYEELVSRGLREDLDQLPDDLVTQLGDLDPAEASLVLSQYVARVARRSLDAVGEGKGGLRQQVRAANALISAMGPACAAENPELASELAADQVDEGARQLLSVVSTRNSATAVTHAGRPALPRPTTSVAQTSLFTGAAHEPQLYEELKREIASADRILMLVSFVKWSGLRLILPELRAFAERGGTLRLITTTYIGATDPKAVRELALLPGAQVRVSYDTKRTRLHAKAYVFERRTGYSTAYIGSSNLSNPAMTSGLEWNVKISRQDQPDTMQKVLATFQTYWHAPEFEPFDAEEDLPRLTAAIDRELGHGGSSDGPEPATFSFDITPYPYQQQILDRLHAEREVGGHWRNLVVAATGTGKTVIAAFDYRDFCARYNDGRPARLLFVAHREEILRQSLACFRGVLRDPNFGELFVGGQEPSSLDQVFVSIQTLNSRDLTAHLDPDFYDFVVVDEFHHAAAASYQRLLTHFSPCVLLGLTATPERADGRSVLGWFDDRIAAEIRLPEAIDRKLLCPFSYFGVTDETDLSTVRWKRGGYDEGDLEKVYVFSAEVARRRARAVAASVRRYVTDLRQVHGLGFCVSKAHAEFMARQFSELGIPSLALTAESDDKTRATAKQRLVRGEVRFVFVVDLYNEGVDIPEVDTILFLRPTQSLTVFLQQLGRGLRLAPGKECLTVLDFIAKPDERFDFESRFAALLERTGTSVRKQVEEGFSAAPKGCYIRLERVAQSYVLANLGRSLDNRTVLVDRIRTFEGDSGLPLTLGNFLAYHRLDPRELVRGGRSFSRLCVVAGVRPDFHEPDEDVLTRALPRIAAIDSRRWIHFLQRALTGGLPAWDELDPDQRRMLRMFQITLWPGSIKARTFADAGQALARVLANPTMAQEIRDLLAWQLDHVDFVDEPVDLGFDCPLDLHCSYTRDQLLVAMDVEDPDSVRQGVHFVRGHGVDVLMNTLNKSEREYSPTTMYEDYSINEWLFHWQSQSTTSEGSPTGRRYVTGRDADGRPTRVALFVREYKRDAGGTAPYVYLGLVSCASHEGSRPMSIVWRLGRPIPAKLLPQTNKLAS